MMTDQRNMPSKPITQAVRAELSLLNSKDVAELLGVNLGWLYRRVEAGDIPTVRLGHRSLRFRPEDIRDFIERNLTSTPPREQRLASQDPPEVRPRRGRPRTA